MASSCDLRESKGEILDTKKKRSEGAPREAQSKNGSDSYADFIAQKSQAAKPVGFEPDRLSNHLYPFQQDLVRWACRMGRAAIFADCGMGKTPMQLEWAHQVGLYSEQRVLILAPLAVAQQTVREAEKFGIEARYLREDDDDTSIVVTNYEILHKFDVSKFGGIVLDESSILKAFDGKTRTQIIESFARTPYRLACTATPAPNDFMELGNHAEFLGVMTRAEMLSMFFVHDGGDTSQWRVKGHAEDAFWKWVCSWAAMIRKPSDLGYDDGAFILPPLEIVEHVVEVDHRDAWNGGTLFQMEALTLKERRDARRASTSKRVSKCAELVNTTPGKWLVWCDLNAEGDALEHAIYGAVQVAGADSPDHKTKSAIDFADGDINVLVSKPSIFGWGLNFQSCANMAFVGLGDSYELFYQAIRRCWRFGQTHPVTCHVITSETEGAVVANIKRKEADAMRMADEMAKHTVDFVRENITKTARQSTVYRPSVEMVTPDWLVSQ